MLFILKGYDRWKIWLLEIYSYFSSSSSSQKGKKNVAVEKMTIGKGKNNKDWIIKT